MRALVRKLLARLHYLFGQGGVLGPAWVHRRHLRVRAEPSRWASWEERVRALGADKPRLHFLTFGDGQRFSPERLAGDVRHFFGGAEFDSVEGWDVRDLDEDFRAKHWRWLAYNRRGFGYWIWKPYLLARALGVLNEGDILIYADAGCTIFDSARARRAPRAWNAMLEQLRGSRDGIALHASASHARLAAWCKQDVLGALGEQAIQDKQLCAGGRIYLRKCAASAKLISDWSQQVAAQHYALFDDTPSRAPNAAQFQEHRHDQAVLSVLLHQGGYEWVECADGDLFFPARLDNHQWEKIFRYGEWNYVVRDEVGERARAALVAYLRWRAQGERLPAQAGALLARLEQDIKAAPTTR